MVEGYILYVSFYYASEYIKQIDNTLGVAIWDDEKRRGFFRNEWKEVHEKE